MGCWNPSLLAGGAKGVGVIEDRDVWRMASLLMQRHGHEAALIAARQVDATLGSGDTEDCAAWKRILEAVAELSRSRPNEGEGLN